MPFGGHPRAPPARLSNALSFARIHGPASYHRRAMLTVLYHHEGRTQRFDAVDPAWLHPDATGLLWVDLVDASPEETRVLGDIFGFHELAIEDALSVVHHPKVEAYPGFLYLIVHGIDFQASQHRFTTHDTDMFIGERFLVTVHSGNRRSIAHVREVCEKHDHLLEQGPMALAHRIIDRMVDNYRPEVEHLAEHLDELEQRVFGQPDDQLMREILSLKRDVASLRRVVQPQRDVIARLARREFAVVTEAVAFGFRDVHDNLVRINDEAAYFQDRIMGLLDAHLSVVSNRLNQVMKVLTLIATLFMPMTVLTGIYGMNVPLPPLPGGEPAQFYWILGMLGATAGGMLGFFYTRKWI
jgi:magnesium transporter